ncbi:MAG: RNA-binding protein [Gammaproteobacteria bacterium]|nr:RNA-binding protein [Gammaproteobacteria bacterium]
MNIYVGNLPYSVREAELRTAFEKFGTVQEAEVIIDRRSNRSRGYGFIRMDDPGEARAAIKALDGSEFKGRQLRVDESRPKAGGSERGGDRGDSRGDQRPARSTASTATTARRPQHAPGGVFGFFKRLFGR